MFTFLKASRQNSLCQSFWFETGDVQCLETPNVWSPILQSLAQCLGTNACSWWWYGAHMLQFLQNSQLFCYQRVPKLENWCLHFIHLFLQDQYCFCSSQYDTMQLLNTFKNLQCFFESSSRSCVFCMFILISLEDTCYAWLINRPQAILNLLPTVNCSFCCLCHFL